MYNIFLAISRRRFETNEILYAALMKKYGPKDKFCLLFAFNT